MARVARLIQSDVKYQSLVNEWINEEFPQGQLVVDCITTVYSSVGASEAKVFKLRCPTGSCIKSYDRVEDSIFCSSRMVRCGSEVGWEFVEGVLSSKQTFSGFVKTMQFKYQRLSSRHSFMSVNTFIKWWFLWASVMEVDFIQPFLAVGMT